MPSPVRRATNDGCGRRPWPASLSWSRFPFGQPEDAEGLADSPWIRPETTAHGAVDCARPRRGGFEQPEAAGGLAGSP
jgi:hypothetical protein